MFRYYLLLVCLSAIYANEIYTTRMVINPRQCQATTCYTDLKSVELQVTSLNPDLFSAYFVPCNLIPEGSEPSFDNQTLYAKNDQLVMCEFCPGCRMITECNIIPIALTAKNNYTLIVCNEEILYTVIYTCFVAPNAIYDDLGLQWNLKVFSVCLLIFGLLICLLFCAACFWKLYDSIRPISRFRLGL